MIPRHWLQYADDAVAISGTESENQILLNAFAKWCAWSGMTIRVDKCSTFGIRKVGTCSKQIKPNLFVNNERIRSVSIGESFVYLGKSFNFNMNNSIQKIDLVTKFSDLMQQVSDLPLDPKNKLLLYHRFILPRISWDLTILDLSSTWVTQNMGNIASRFFRSWLEVPVSGTLDILTLPKSKYGFNIVQVSTRYIQCQVACRNSS
jgi:hypothetical protein